MCRSAVALLLTAASLVSAQAGHVGFLGSDQESFAWSHPDGAPLSARSAARALLQLVGAPTLADSDFDSLPVPDAVAPTETWVQLALENLVLAPESTPKILELLTSARNAELSGSPRSVMRYVSSAMSTAKNPVAPLVLPDQDSSAAPRSQLQGLADTLAKHGVTAVVDGDSFTVQILDMAPVAFDSALLSDRQFLQEMAILADARSLVASSPNARVLSMEVTSLQDMVDGDGPSKLRVATWMLDSLVASAVESEWPRALGKSLGVQLLIGDSRRRLEDDPDYYTLPEIVTFQINLWTAVALVLVLLSALCCMVNMDIQPDSLLYAKFQADVSSKFD